MKKDLEPLTPTPPGLYRHYKGRWYEVLDTVRCSETLQAMTLYRALYGEQGLWVRPAAMFEETAEFQGRTQRRFTPQDWRTLPLDDLPTSRAVVAHVSRLIQASGQPHREPPSEPTTCCGRGCTGCVWLGYFGALTFWRDDAVELLATAPGSPGSR